ncbi:hypothetical protein C8Q76DRAFT_39627 [Earliella scabrosa]|nr:hypothetical protein C8Q76DRAFT_39627 [Earliella scabrosa]
MYNNPRRHRGRHGRHGGGDDTTLKAWCRNAHRRVSGPGWWARPSVALHTDHNSEYFSFGARPRDLAKKKVGLVNFLLSFFFVLQNLAAADAAAASSSSSRALSPRCWYVSPITMSVAVLDFCKQHLSTTFEQRRSKLEWFASIWTADPIRVRAPGWRAGSNRGQELSGAPLRHRPSRGKVSIDTMVWLSPDRDRRYAAGVRPRRGGREEACFGHPGHSHPVIARSWPTGARDDRARRGHRYWLY